MGGRFATLKFERQIGAPAGTLWQAWTAPAARCCNACRASTI